MPVYFTSEAEGVETECNLSSRAVSGAKRSRNSCMTWSVIVAKGSLTVLQADALDLFCNCFCEARGSYAMAAVKRQQPDASD